MPGPGGPGGPKGPGGPGTQRRKGWLGKEREEEIDKEVGKHREDEEARGEAKEKKKNYGKQNQIKGGGWLKCIYHILHPVQGGQVHPEGQEHLAL